MSYFNQKEQELKDAFGEGHPMQLQKSPEADDPNVTDHFGACVEVKVDGLKIRLVRDRGIDHIDVDCLSTNGVGRRWVALEVLAVALDPGRLDDYEDAFKATVDACDNDKELDDNTRMPLGSDPLCFINKNLDRLKLAAQNKACISEAETRISAKTAEILKIPSLNESQG